MEGTRVCRLPVTLSLPLDTKLFLVPNEPLQSQVPELEPVPPLQSLRGSRKQYANLLLEKMRAPDGSYEESFVLPGSYASRQRKPKPGNLEMNNPLSLHDEVLFILQLFY